MQIDQEEKYTKEKETEKSQFDPSKWIRSQYQNLQMSSTLAINQRSAELESQGRKVYRFGFGQSPFPVPERIVKKLQKNAFQNKYTSVEGIKELRQTIAKFESMQKTQDPTFYSENNVIIAPGSKLNMVDLMMILKCTTLITTPAWVSYAKQAQILDLPIEYIHTSFEDDYKIKPQILQEKLSKINGTVLLILNAPNNPTGQSYSKQELEELSVVLKKHPVIVLADEIYSFLSFDNDYHSIAEFCPERTIISSGISKGFGAGGWRLGYLVFPEQLSFLIKPIQSLASEVFSSTSSPIQYSAVSIFSSLHKLSEYLDKSIIILRSIANFGYKTFTKAKIRTVFPNGGFYFYIDFENFRTSLESNNIKGSQSLCEHILQDANVALLAAKNFNRDINELAARLAFVDFDGKLALDNFSYDHVQKNGFLTDSFLREFCGKTIEGFEKLANWVPK
ncbi:pyridoxal phosphate-dependent aminotransferase [Anaeramoeba ignava]|uniref:Pyridoxal phosphate-dependent aminotransferase n=1 Tax=Anaeramoeba ignava TaxID=1746090 RepID=A0A9Q0LNV3_ANAIG|nr:pyridoxal phosphate-dependent aminotransferase [Anaeramoeba ignava]